MKIENENRIIEYVTEWEKYDREYLPQRDRIESDRGLSDAFRRLKERIKILSAEARVEPEFYCERLKILHTFLDDLGYALNPDIHRLKEDERLYEEKVRAGLYIPVWHHRIIANMYWLMEVENDKTIVDPTQIDKLVARYLSHRWMRDDWIDWALFDAYVWYEVAAGWKLFLSSFPWGWPRWERHIDGTNLTKTYHKRSKVYWIRKGYLLAGIFIRYVIPIAALFIFWERSSLNVSDLDLLSLSGSFLEWATRLYLLYLAVRSITWPFRIRARRKINKNADEIDRGVVKLQEIYMALADPPISLKNLRHYVYTARDESITLRSGAYSLLDELERRGKVVLAWEDRF